MTVTETSIIPSYDFDKLTGWRLDLPSYIEPGTRALCLYRVSTGKQLYHSDDNEPDIPMQRVRCREFCERMGWTLVCELQEEGVSGHKVRAEHRDKVQLIKEYAKQGKFDILLVFMFDRIGRISDETPFVVEWLIANNIRVWSALEGEQRIESHTDRLTNYIRYWQADGESQKISARTSNSMGVLTQEGCFTGGLCAYGYQYVKRGRTNRRKQEVFDLAICEEEAFVVHTIFRLAADEGYGAQRIANHLNAKGIKNRSGKNWHPASIQGMLKNILYTGILRSGESRSQVQEHLRIIDDKTFGIVQDMLAARSRKHEALRSKPLNTRGRSLLSGNIFCGHCGARLCVTTSGKGRRRRDGTDVVRMRYTCQTKSRTHGDCDGQTGYTVEKLDAIIESIVRDIFSRVNSLEREDVLAITNAVPFETIERLGDVLAQMSAAALPAYKALMTATHCQNIVDALDLAEQLDEYILSPSIASPEDAAAEELAFILPEKAAKMIRPHINLHTYGQALLASRNNIQTEYGLLERRDGQSIQIIGQQKQEPQLGGMELG